MRRLTLRKGKRMRPSPTALKLVARDRNRVAPKATGGFATARAAAGVLAVSGHQQKATPDSGKGARPRAERSPRSPIVHRRHLKFGAVSDSAQSPVHHARLGGSGLATGSPPPAPLQPARTGVRIGLSVRGSIAISGPNGQRGGEWRRNPHLRRTVHGAGVATRQRLGILMKSDVVGWRPLLTGGTTAFLSTFLFSFSLREHTRSGNRGLLASIALFVVAHVAHGHERCSRRSVIAPLA